jgi:hypothetical protein
MRPILRALRRTAIPIGTGLILSGVFASGCVGDGPSGLDLTNIEVTVAGIGDGTGTVLAPDVGVDINCTSTAGTETGLCHDEFDDIGGGGVFTLEATPLLPGSEFAGYTGDCSSISGADGTVCTLTFKVGESRTFNVTANFHLKTPPPASDSVTIYNASDTHAYYLVGPGETAGASNLVQAHNSRRVLIPTAVGSQAVFRAYLTPGGLAVGTTTCQVTAGAWSDPLSPPLVAFYDSDGYFMTCSSGLVAL